MAHTGLQCPNCEIISAIPEEDAELIRQGAEVLVDCPLCQVQFIGGPLSGIWTFSDNRDPEERYPPDVQTSQASVI